MATQTRHSTVEQFDRFVNLPENADRLFEYVGGDVLPGFTLPVKTIFAD